MPYVEEKERAESKTVVMSEVGQVFLKMKEVLEDFEIGEAERLFYTVWPGEYEGDRLELMRELKESIELADYYESLDHVERLIETYTEK